MITTCWAMLLLQVVPEGSLGLIFAPKPFVKLQCCHVRPPLWRLMNADDGKRENASLLLLLFVILKILPVT